MKYLRFMINEILTESQHISDDVRGLTFEMFDEIGENLKRVEFKPVNELNKFIKVGNVTIKKTLFDNANVNFNVTFYNFTIPDEFNELSDYYSEGKSVCIDSRGKNFLSTLNIVLKSGVLVKEKNIDTISHELLHIYEQNKIRDEFKEKFSNTTNKTLMFSSNEAERKLGEVFYLSSNSEQDSFLNGAYNEMMSNLSPNVEECFKKTILYNKLERFDTLLEFFEKEDVSEILRNYYNITYEYFLKYIRSKFSILKKKTAVVLDKVNKEKIKQNWR